MEPAGFNDAAASGVELLDRLFETDLLKLQFICLFQNTLFTLLNRNDNSL